MKTNTKLLAIAICACGLTGCSSSDTPVQAITPSYTSFAAITADATIMQSNYTDTNGLLNAGVTPAAVVDIPSTGTASYRGFVNGDVAGSGLTGKLLIVADFAGNTADATAGNFLHETGGDYIGTLTGSGPITRSPSSGAPQVSSTLGGTLVNGSTNVTTTIALEGDILANGTDPVGAIAGQADGLFGANLFTGVFAAEK